MARKQSDYLAGLLGEEPETGVGDTPAVTLGPGPAPAPGRPARERGLTLLSRETALARVASGEVRQVTQLAIDPARCRIWAGNARAYDRLNEASCRELIDSIVAEGGQKVPAVVRRIEGDADHDYEVIAGTRRHWSIAWLRANSYPDMVFVAQVHLLDDEAAFRLADLENRARADVSDLERARNYAVALGEHYGGHLTRMAERLNVSKGWLSKLVKVAGLPDAVLAAFASVADVSLASLYPLAQALGDKAIARAITSMAHTIMCEQVERADAGLPPFPAPVVVRRLLDAPSFMAGIEKVDRYTAASRYGRTMLSVTAANRQGVTLRLHSGSGATRAEVVAAIERALDALDQSGTGLAQ